VGRPVQKNQQFDDALELCLCIYKLTAGFPSNEVDGLGRQLREAVVALAVRIAEFRQSAHLTALFCELDVLLVIAEKLGFANPEKFKEAIRLSEKIANSFKAAPEQNAAPPSDLPQRVPVGGIITPQ